MDHDPIYNTIVDSIKDAFGTMLMVDVDFLDTDQFVGQFDESRIITTIGLGGEGIEASLNLVFTSSSASSIVEIMLGEEPSEAGELTDGIGELANWVAGGIKSRLEEQEMNFNISLPSVIDAAGANLSTRSATALYPFRFIVESESMVEGVFLIREPVKA